MKKNCVKKIKFNFLLGIFFCFSLNAFAFDWPQKQIESDTFFSYFGQLSGSVMETSLVFKESSPVKAADKGTITTIVREHGEDFGWFESPLGNAVVIVHDEIATVYGNLDAETIESSIYEKNSIELAEPIAESGNSGWQEGVSCLEFQILDFKNKNAINPRVLMPRVGRELTLIVGEITAVDRDGKSYNLSQVKNLKSGFYSVYRSRQSIAVPYKTTIAINGAAVETISYDVITSDDGRLCVRGNTLYPIERLYPDSKKMLLGQLHFTSGRNTLTVNVQDILGASKSASYVITAY